MKEPYYLPNGDDHRPHEPDASAQVADRIARQCAGETVGII